MRYHSRLQRPTRSNSPLQPLPLESSDATARGPLYNFTMSMVRHWYSRTPEKSRRYDPVTRTRGSAISEIAQPPCRCAARLLMNWGGAQSLQNDAPLASPVAFVKNVTFVLVPVPAPRSQCQPTASTHCEKRKVHWNERAKCNRPFSFDASGLPAKLRLSGAKSGMRTWNSSLKINCLILALPALLPL